MSWQSNVQQEWNGRPTLAWIAGSDLNRWVPLLKQLSEHFHIIAAGSDGDQVELLQAAGIEAYEHTMGRGFDPWGDLVGLRKLRRQLVQWRPDVVLFTDTKASILGPLAGRLARVPAVIRLISGLGTLHSYTAPWVLRRRRVLQWVLRMTRDVADLTLFQSPSDQLRYTKLGLVNSRRSRLIDGIASVVDTVPRETSVREIPARESVETDPEKQAPSRNLHRTVVRRRLGLPDDSEIVLLQTRLTCSKGIDDLIHAIPLLQGQRPGCRVVVSGQRDVEALDALSDRQLTELQRHALWLGPCNDEDDLLQAADLFVYPSFYREGVPRSLVRAAHHGLPIVAVDSDSNRQVVEHGETGWLVPRNRPKQLAEALEMMLSDASLAKQLADRAQAQVRERFSACRGAQELSTLLDSVLRAASRQHKTIGVPQTYDVSP